MCVLVVVFAGGMHYDFTQDELQEVGERFGPAKAKITKDPVTTHTHTHTHTR
jgi:hypothetical protein